MKISIITINFNNSEGLEKTIQSVAKQIYNNIEYLIIDGGSVDNSSAIAKSYEDKISYFISEPDNGIYHAMNKGIKQSTGDYLLFLNSGDQLIDELVIQKVIESGLIEDLVYGNLLFLDNKKEWTWSFSDILTFEHFYQSTIPHPSTFIKKQLFEKVGYYDENLKIVSDWKFFILATARFNCTYKHIPMIITAYTFDGISSRPENLKAIDIERSNVLKQEFPLFIKDYENLTSLRNEIKEIKYFIKTRKFIKQFFKLK